LTEAFPDEVECSICGTRSVQVYLVEEGRSGGLPDLDTRPPELTTAALVNRIQRCPKCGYCARDITGEFPSAREIIETQAYRKALKTRATPATASNYLCWSMIQEAAEEYPGAGWAALHAAWICDDANKPAQAENSRQKAIQLFEKARQLGRPFAPDRATEVLILVDLYRRTKQFAKAKRLSQDAMAEDSQSVIAQIFRFEEVLANQEDAEGHSLAAVPGIQNE
jgi:hypothetical protein